MPAHKTKKPAADKRGGVAISDPKGKNLTCDPKRRSGVMETFSLKDADDLWAVAAHALLDGYIGAAKEEVSAPPEKPTPRVRRS